MDITPYFAYGANTIAVTLKDECGYKYASTPVWLVASYPQEQGLSPNECPFCGNSERQGYIGGPINTASQNYNYEVTDLSIPTAGQPLQFVRTYNSTAANRFYNYSEYSRPFGVGWTHNHDIRLLLSTSLITDPVNGLAYPSGTIGLKAPHGSLLTFFPDSATHYSAAPGVQAVLSRSANSPYVYTVTTSNQTTFIFNDKGLLTQQRDPAGQVLSYTYYVSTTTPLKKVSDSTGQRYLEFLYKQNPNSGGAWFLTQVRDPIGRHVDFNVPDCWLPSCILKTITDTRGLPWTYQYGTGSAKFSLTSIIDPDGRTVERTDYDSTGKSVVRQWNGANELIAQFTVDPSASNIITMTDALSRTTVHNYSSGVWAGGANAATQAITRSYDTNFRLSYVADPNGHGPQIKWSANGSNLERVVDAGGFTTTMQYDGLNNPTLITDTRNFTTAYVYSGTLLTRQIDAVGNTTVYTYGPSNLLIAQQDALGRITRYQYDTFGQRTVMTDALNNVTRYQYDAVGRLITTTDALGRMTVNAYDNADHVIAVTNNYTSTSAQQNYLNTYNLITRYGYDGFGRQIAVTDTLNHVTRSYFDPAGRLISTTQNFSPTVGPNYANTWNLITRYGYDAVGNQIAVTDTLGFVTRTDYDSLNRPVTVTQNYKGNGNFDPSRPDENVKHITHYDPAGNVLEQIDPLGNITRNGYDALNRVISTTTNYTTTPGVDPNTYNLTTWYEYDPAGNQVAITDTQQHVMRNYYDSLGRLISTTVNYRSDVGPNYLNTYNLTTRYEYDRVGNRVAITDALGAPTRYGYDQLNRVIATTNVSGTTYTQYDALGNRRVVTDALAHTTVYTYNAVGQLIKMQDAAGNVTAYGYDALGRTIVVTDPLTHTTRTFYDAAGRVVSTTNALTGTTVVVYDALGQRIRMQDARGSWTDYQYDGLGRTISVTDATNSVMQYRYDAAGNRVKVIDGLNHPMTSTYDAAHRLIMTQDALGNPTRYGYDGLGNRLVMTDANGVVTRYGYDALNRLVAVTESVTSTVGLDPNKYNLVTRYGYDAVGNRIAMTDALTHTTVYTYDLLSRLIMMQDARGSLTRYVYDAVGNRTKVIDANGQTITYTYDALDRNTKIDYGASVVTFEYDKVGNRKTMTDSLGVTRYVYDELSRLKQVTDPFTGTVQYRYDAVGNRTQTIYPDGKVVTSTFDAANRLTGTLSWDGQLTTYQFDKAGRLITTTLPNGVRSVNGYDVAGRLVNLTHIGPYWTLAAYTYTLDAVGNRLAVMERVLPPTPFIYLPVLLKDFAGSGEQMLPGGQSSPFASPVATPPPFDSPLLPTSSLPPHSAAAPMFDPALLIIAPIALAAVVASRKGRKWALLVAVLTGALVIVGQTHTSGALPAPMPFLSPQSPPPGCTLPTAIGDMRVISYTYDPLYRLNQAAYSSGECYQYAYDRVGNRTAMTTTVGTTTFQYDAANRMINAGGITYTWDNNGNLLNDGSALYRYDRANRLISTTLSGSTSLFNYNGDGVRLKQTVAGVVTTYTQDMASPLPVVVQAKTGTATTQYLYAVGTRPLAQYTSGGAEYLLSDALGSVRQIADANGNVTLAKSYEPYGSVLSSNGSANSMYGFTGEQTDGQTGLLFLRARYLQPRLGIFLARDPWSGDVMRPGSMNGFNYVSGNPINLIDPTGMQGPIVVCQQNPQLCEAIRHAVEVGAGTVVAIVEAGATTTLITVSGVGFLGANVIVLAVFSPQQKLWPPPVTVPAPPQPKPTIYVSPIPQPRTADDIVRDGGWTGRSPVPDPQRPPTPDPNSERRGPRDPGPWVTCTPTPTRKPDFIWRGIDDPIAKPRHFKPRFPRDAEGLSFYEGRANMWAETLKADPDDRKLFRAGFTRSVLIASGFSVFRDDVPPGHTSIRRLNNQEWEEWLYANNSQHPYQQTLASLTAIVEPNTAP